MGIIYGGKIFKTARLDLKTLQKYKNSVFLGLEIRHSGFGAGRNLAFWFRGWLDIFRSERAVLTIFHHILCPMGPVKEKNFLRYVPFKRQVASCKVRYTLHLGHKQQLPPQMPLLCKGVAQHKHQTFAILVREVKTDSFGAFI